MAASVAHLPKPVPRERHMRCDNDECDRIIDRDSEDDCACKKNNFKSPLFSLTDTGNAERIAYYYAERLRFCGALGGWLIYDGKRWRRDDIGEIEQLAKKAIGVLAFEAPWCGEDAEDVWDHHKRSLSARGILNACRLAQSDPRLAARAEDFDRDPWLLNVQNGTLDLRSGELRAHAPVDMLTRVAAAGYDDAARSELWERVVRDSQNGADDCVAFIQCAAGYSLTGRTDEEKLFFVHGPAAASKSTFLEAVRVTLGDYAMVSDFEAFLKKRDGGASNGIARLAGARLVSSIEVEQGRALAEGLVKQLTGGDVATARFHYKEFFEFRPQFKLWLVANDAPHINSEDSGMWRRVLRIPFEHVVPPEKRDPKVKATLLDVEQSGAAILAWLVQGCLEWQRTGLKVPASIEAATAEYRDSQDAVAGFFSDECVFETTAQCTRSELLARYEQWAKANGGARPLTPKGLAERVRKRGVSEDRTRGARLWRGIGLIDRSAIEWESANDGRPRNEASAPEDACHVVSPAAAPVSGEKRTKSKRCHESQLELLTPDHARASREFTETGDTHDAGDTAPVRRLKRRSEVRRAKTTGVTS